MGDDERDMFRNRESLSYVWPLSDHGFTDFHDSGFREQWCLNFLSAYLGGPPRVCGLVLLRFFYRRVAEMAEVRRDRCRTQTLLRELSACIPQAGGINMRRIRSKLSSDCFTFLICVPPPFSRERRHFR